MTLLSGFADFLDFEKLPKAITADQLAIPETPLGTRQGQGYDLRMGDEYVVFGKDRKIVGFYVVKSWRQGFGGMPRRVELANSIYGEEVFLTDWQLNWLEREGRIRPNFLSQDGSPDRGSFPGSALTLTKRERDFAEGWLAMVEAVLAHCDGREMTPTLVMEAATAHAEGVGSKVPCYTTVKAKLDIFLTRGFFDPIVALAPKRRRGNTTSRFGYLVESIISEAVQTAWETPGGTWRTVDAVFWKIVREKHPDLHALWEKKLDRDGRPLVAMPSDRTLQRRLGSVDHYTRDHWRYGEAYARKRHAAYIRQVLPDMPLDIVDCDHVTLDVFLIDDDTPTAYGRPDLIAFRDRKTGCILGYSLSFGTPSFESFLEGLQNAWFPKNMSAYPGLEWGYYGRFARLGVDNALHLIGKNIAHAARELRFQIVEYRPGQPWMKGALERENGILNSDVSHRVRGSTESNPVDREKFDKERMAGAPVLTIGEFDALLVTYLCTIHHHEAHQGLGMLRTLSGVPDKLWWEGIEQTRLRTVGDTDVFTRLAGDTSMRTIQSIGIELDHVCYQSAELRAFAAHPKHKEGSKDHDATKYEVTRNPSNIGGIWVKSPFIDQPIFVPACGADLSYAEGMKLSKHRALVAHHNQTVGTPANVEKLRAARRDFEMMLVELHQRRKKAGTAAKIARFIGDQRRRLTRSTPVVAVSGEEASAARLDFKKPAKAAPKPKVSTRADKTSVSPAAGGAASPPPKSKAKAAAPSSQIVTNTSGAQSAQELDVLSTRHPKWDC